MIKQIRNALIGLFRPFAARSTDPVDGQYVAEGIESEGEGNEAGSVALKRDDTFHADLATCVWRMRRKLESSGSPDAVLRSVQLQVDRMSDILTEAGVEAQELLNAKYVDGMAVRVLAFQPEPDGDHTISEVIAPGIFIDDTLCRMGEVVVAIPDAAELPSEDHVTPDRAGIDSGDDLPESADAVRATDESPEIDVHFADAESATDDGCSQQDRSEDDGNSNAEETATTHPEEGSSESLSGQQSASSDDDEQHRT